MRHDGFYRTDQGKAFPSTPGPFPPSKAHSVPQEIAELDKRNSQTEVSNGSNTPIQQAEVILKLYELRRETVMREARSYVGGEFMPASVSELVQLVSAGGKHASFILQVYGYWDMVAAFVIHGALALGLAYDTCQEMYFQYEKIQPHLTSFRSKMNLPEFLRSIEQVVEGSEQGRSRLETMRKNLSAIAEVRAQTMS